jgi:Ca2+-binding EF-hand superfamily protein
MVESVGEMMIGKVCTLFTMTDKDFDGLVCLEEFGEFNRVLEKLGKEPISTEKSTVTFDEFMELLTIR